MLRRPVTPHTEHIHSTRDSCRVDLSPYIQNTYILAEIVVDSTCHPTYKVDLSFYKHNIYILPEIVDESTCRPTYRTHTFYQGQLSSRPVTLHTEHIHSSRDSYLVGLSPYIQNTYILRGIAVKSTCHPTYRTHTFYQGQLSSRPVTLHKKHTYSSRDRCRVDLLPYIQNTCILAGIVVESTCHPTYWTHTF